MHPSDLFASPPPRNETAVAPFVRAASRHVRWFMYAVLIFDAACLAAIVGPAHPDDRVRYVTAFAVVFALFTLPFYLLYRRAVRATRRLFEEGSVQEATVVKVRQGHMRGTPIHHIRVEYTDALGERRKGSFSMAGATSGLAEGDTVPVLSHAELGRNLFVVSTPAHGVQPGRHDGGR